jgi:kynurenine formamidase
VTAWPTAAPRARIVDLTHPLVGQAPTYPGQPASLFQTVATVTDGGFLMSEIHPRSHVGTHADSPAHFIADGAAAEWIIEAGFGLVGLDFGSPDETGSPTERCHHTLLGADVLIIENLNGLEELDAGWCWFCAAPLLTGGGDGGFCRAFAGVPS